MPAGFPHEDAPPFVPRIHSWMPVADNAASGSGRVRDAIVVQILAHPEMSQSGQTLAISAPRGSGLTKAIVAVNRSSQRSVSTHAWAQFPCLDRPGDARALEDGLVDS